MTRNRGAAALAAVLLACATSAVAASGGPDGFGYTWRDSAEPGVVFAWEDIAATGRDVGVDGDDVNYGFQPLSFTFPFYGGAYSQVAACSNGWLSVVDAADDDFTNEPLPDATTPIGVIAAFWDDLRYTTGVSRVLFHDFGDRAVVTWENQHDLGDAAAVNTFQAILHADGRIRVQYQSLLGDRTSCTLGIESPDELNGLTVHHDVAAGVPPGAYAVELSPPVPVPNDLACGAALPLACGDRASGDTRAQGAAGQDGYLCSRGDYSGREQVYVMSFPTPGDVRLLLDVASGDPDMVVLAGCDPNACLSAPGDAATLTSVSGTVYVVIDSAPGQEGAYRLRVDCLPLPIDVDCANAPPIACEEAVTGDTTLGAARQDAYLCSPADYGGAEQVYRLDLAAPTRVEINLTELGGDPDLVLLAGCDPGACQVMDSGSLVLDDVSGTYYLVVDSAPGSEGRYELTVNCLSDNLAFCGAGLLEMDPWGAQDGVWLVEGWLFHPFDTHDFALRVDGGAAYGTGGSCPDFASHAYGVRPNGPAFAEWGAAEGTVRTEMIETSLGGCCGLVLTMTVTNTDVVPHYYEFRAYHDTAFGIGDGGACGGTGTIDGGHVEIDGAAFGEEIDLLAVGADSCVGQVRMFGADHPTELRSSFQMLPPNLPNTMEYIHWNDGGEPCTTWKGLADGYVFPTCPAQIPDDSLLLIWRFPRFGTLAPGESDIARYRIGLRCAWPCDLPCESPAIAWASAADVSPCQGGIEVTWSAAVFPGSGNGVYHVYRSTVDAADALARPPLTPVGGVAATSWIDMTTVSGFSYTYVVMAESLDFPGCGPGPAVRGSTATAAAPLVQDGAADLDPPSTQVGSALRAVGHAPSTVDFDWSLAPPPAADERYVVLRSDDDPRGPFLVVAQPPSPAWTDPNAPPRYIPVHVWFYDVRVADACGNLSLD